MRVNITYSVPLTDVPDEVDKILEAAIQSIEAATSNLANSTATQGLEKVELIGDTRQCLLEADLRLSDCLNILSGYIDIKSKEQVGQQSYIPEAPDEEGI
jgi:hypothetical protein